MKKLLILAAAIFLGANHYPPIQGEPVVDAANVIPDNTEHDLDAKLFDYEKTAKHQLMVATVPSLEGDDIEHYSNEYFRQVKLGDPGRNDGILMVVAPKEHKVRLEVGYGMGEIFTDAQAGQVIRDDMIPYFKQNDFGGGIEAGVADIIKQTTPKTPAELALEAQGRARAQMLAQERNQKMAQVFYDVLLWIVGLIVGGLAIFGISAPYRRRRRERIAAEEALERRAEEKRIREEQAALAKAQAKREAAQRRAKARARAKREAMLAAMTPEARAAFLAKEQKDREEAEARTQKEAEEAEAARKRRQEEDDSSSSYSSSSWGASSSDYGSSFGGSSGGDSFGGWGGDSGGGGASGSW